MAHRRQGSRAARRQGDPSFIFEDFTGDPKGPGHPGASAGPGGKSKIPGPVKDHRGKSRGPKSKGKNSRERAQGGGNAEAKAESPEGRGSPGGPRSAEPAPRAEEASPASRPLTNGVNSDRKPAPLSEPHKDSAVQRELRSNTEPLKESGIDTKKSSSETNGKEVNSVATPLIDNSESPEESETVTIEPSSSVFETVEEPADEKGLHNSGLLNKPEHISETDIKTSKVNDMEPKQSEDDRGEPSVLSKAKNSPAEPKPKGVEILKEAEVDNSESFRHIEINYMDPVQQLQTIVEETREPEAAGAESQKEQEDTESKESSETEEGAGKTMGEDSGQAHPQSARERKTKIPGLLKEPNSKGSGNKGLRVTFDLSNTQEKDENVIDSWEDLSDADGGDLVIDEDDIIDCGVKLSTMDDLLDLGEGLDVESPLTSPESGKPNESIQWFRPSDEFRSEPLDGKASNKAGDGSGGDKAIPGVDDVRAGASGAKEDERNSGDNTPILGADIIPLSISVYNEGNNSVEIPFIDGEEETCVDDDDDEWETEPSGSSSENGNSDKVLNVECRKEAPDKVIEGEDEKISQREEKEQQGIREEEEDRTLVDQPSIEEDNSEKDDDLITKEDIDVVFMALEKSPVKGETVPLATPEILSPIMMDASPPQKTQSRVFVGPLPRSEHTYAWDRPGSPQVSIGYECQERKAASICSSETESDGELVPCEDKCIGTADFLVESDSEPLDLSSSSNDRTSSVCDTLSSQSQDAVEVRDVGKKASSAPDDDVHAEGARNEKDTLAVSDAQPDSSSPSSDGQEEVNCVGKSESGKESQINGKKNGKKKGKKNKRELIAEPAPVPEHILGRPKLVRGRTWKEKRERFIKEYQDPLSLSFGKELCESEIVEDASNLLTETCTEASLEALPKSSSETTLVMLPSRTDPLATAVNESSPSAAADVGASNPPEVNIEDEALWISRNIVPPPPKVAIEVTAASDEDESDFHSVHEKEDFYVVKAKETAKPLEAKTEYVGDSESSDEGPQQPHDQKAPEETACEVWAASTPLIGISLEGSQLVKEKSHDLSESPIDSSDNSAYTDAKDSSCAESLPHSYDYVRSFPEVIGTQSLNLVYSYETDSDFNSKPDQWSSRSKDTSLVMNGRGKNELEKAGPDVPAGEIVYEGPCSCRPGESRMGPLLPSYLAPTVGVGMRVGSQDSPLGVPSLFESDHDDVFSDDAMKLVVDSLVNEDSETLQDSAGDNDANGSDIRSRIKEIVGPRLQRERGRPTARGGRDEGDQGGEEHLLTSGESPRGGREESPLPGSSPASSSGVQGSDEMSLSRSRSISPASKEPASASVIPAPYAQPDMIFEGCPLQQELSPDKMDPAESLRALRFESGLDSSPEKPQQVDCSFRTFRDMYQINPVYLTDSDDPEDPTESDTIVQGSGGYDLDRSITVNSIVQRWEVLQAQAVERQRQSGQVRELQRQVKSLRVVLESLIERASDTTQVKDLETHHQLSDKLQELKNLQQEVMTRKGEVSSVNLAVHRFMTETGYSLAHLKDEVADLYRLWDEAHKRASSELSRLEGVEATWRLWEAQAEELRRALRKDCDTLKVLDAAIQTGSLTDTATASMQDVERLLNDRRKSQPGKRLTLQHTRTQGVDIQGSTTSLGASGDECLSDSGTSGYESCSSEELSERERRLAHLRRLARDLEASLHPNSQAWLAITKTLSSAESELKDLQKHCRELVVRSAESLDQAKTSPQLRRRSWTKDTKGSRTGRLERRGHCALSGRDGCGRGVSSGRRGWMWRVVRAALPFQAALLLLFCVACLLEPNCCDHVNTLNLSLSPQLRYVHGPPPV
ncbi:uncharacterized protein LOC125040954 isoform X2 [Penaeus chinensis]|uniref:uncharacterized protein LOC125040954 isoform X2 n=1 Tax=Penaeus chinensis TaxID=139456 RepID=UPI001FB6F15F|nr:uncharacterized protein LOC125040954 isoform X2 [Penaeus chinensis]